MVWLFAALPALLFVLMFLIPALDPKRENYQRSPKAYNATVNAIVSVTVAVDLIVLFSSLGLVIRVDVFVKGVDLAFDDAHFRGVSFDNFLFMSCNVGSCFYRAALYRRTYFITVILPRVTL